MSLRITTAVHLFRCIVLADQLLKDHPVGVRGKDHFSVVPIDVKIAINFSFLILSLAEF